MSIFDDDIQNKNFLSNFALILLSISIIGCILTIIDFHIDLHAENKRLTKSKEFGYFIYGFNVLVIIGNLSYIGFAIHRYNKFTKEKNKEIIKQVSLNKLI